MGHVDGSLFLNGSLYNWQGLSYNSEVSTGVNTSLLVWDSVNPYGDKVEMKLYSVPSSGVVLEKVIGRVGGYSLQNEVYTPVVEFRQGSANNLYRVTAVLTNYSGQEQYVTSTVPVSGTGNALKVMSTKNTDYVYAGKAVFHIRHLHHKRKHNLHKNQQ